MIELLAILGLYVFGAALICAGAAVMFGTGVCLIVAGAFSLVAAFMLSRGIARVTIG